MKYVDFYPLTVKAPFCKLGFKKEKKDCPQHKDSHVTTGFLIIQVYYNNKTNNYKYNMVLNEYINKRMLTNLEAIMCKKKTSEYIKVG